MAIVAASAAAVGGTFAWATLPLVSATTLLFLVSGARVPSNQRALDAAILLIIGVLALQLAPLPPAALHALSPAAPRVQDLVGLAPFDGWRPLTIHPAASRDSLLIAFAAVLMLWSSRAILSRGGARTLAQGIAGVGFAISVVALAQHLTAPKTILWRWLPLDARASPYGPFINRNEFATWLIMTIAIAAGYVAARFSRRARVDGSARGIIVQSLADNTVLILGALGVMVVALVATLSRSGFIGVIATVIFTAAVGRTARTRRPIVAAAAAVAILLLALGLWVNPQGMAERLFSTLEDPGPTSRLAIWRETLRIIQDFPWTGTGVGTFGDAMVQYQQASTFVLFNHAHNEYLQLLTEGGIIAAVCLLAFALLFIRQARRALADDQSTQRYIRVAAAGGLVGVAVQSLWQTGLRTPANLILAAVLAALVLRDNVPSDSTSQ